MKLNNFIFLSIILSVFVGVVTKAHAAPIHTVAVFGNVAQLEMVLKNGADINAKYYGYTPLMLAIHHGDTDMVKRLLKSGADVDIVNNEGKNALMLARENGDKDILELVLDAC